MNLTIFLVMDVVGDAVVSDVKLMMLCKFRDFDQSQASTTSSHRLRRKLTHKHYFSKRYEKKSLKQNYFLN